MRTMKKLAALLLALVMALALTVPALAVDPYSITVKNGNKNVSIDGNTYSAYKLFDVTYDGQNHFAYTVSSEFANFTYTVNGKDYSGDALIAYLATLNNDADALDAFAKAALAYIEQEEIQPAGTAIAANETAAISLDKPGYYLVTGKVDPKNGGEKVTAACDLTTTDPTATVNVKADAPSVDKKIVEGENKVVANTASIGDAVKYEITSKVPNMKGYTKYFFVMQDTLSKGLTFNDDMEITVGGVALTKGTDYTLTVTNNTDGTTSLEIVFKDFIQYKAGDAITVTYSATLNQNAELNPAVGNPNEVKLTYSNNPNTAGTGEPNPDGPDKPGPNEPTGETPKSETKTYVTGIKITKVDDSTPAKPLTGAKFEISGTGMKVVLVNREMYKVSDNGTFYMLKDGTYTETAPVTDKDAAGYNADKYDSTTTKYEQVTVVDKTTVPTQINATGYVNANGVLTFVGLGAGTYTIKEIIAPNGYNLLKDPITVTITADATLTGCTWTVVKTGETTNLEAGADHLFALTVVNNAGTELPSTGGIGTTIFYVLGSVLVIGAAVVLITRKRMGKSDK